MHTLRHEVLQRQHGRLEPAVLVDEGAHEAAEHGMRLPGVELAVAGIVISGTAANFLDEATGSDCVSVSSSRWLSPSAGLAEVWGEDVVAAIAVDAGVALVVVPPSATICRIVLIHPAEPQGRSSVVDSRL